MVDERRRYKWTKPEGSNGPRMWIDKAAKTGRKYTRNERRLVTSDSGNSSDEDEYERKPVLELL